MFALFNTVYNKTILKKHVRQKSDSETAQLLPACNQSTVNSDSSHSNSNEIDPPSMESVLTDEELYTRHMSYGASGPTLYLLNYLRDISRLEIQEQKANRLIRELIGLENYFSKESKQLEKDRVRHVISAIESFAERHAIVLSADNALNPADPIILQELYENHIAPFCDEEMSEEKSGNYQCVLKKR